MENFNLDRALANWRKGVVDAQMPEAGDLAELESGLLDRYDELLIKGHSPKDAFETASQRTLTVPTATYSKGQLSKGQSVWSLLANYAKVARRNLRARRWYNLTNYATLTLGIITAALALMYWSFETSYDSHLSNVDNKYRAAMSLRSQGYSMIGFRDYNSSSAEVQQQQIDGFATVPGVSQAVQFITFPEANMVSLNERDLAVENILQTNTPNAFIDFFDVDFLAGDPKALGNAPNQVLLTESTASRYLGSAWREENLSEKTVRIDTTNYTVSGIIADPPGNAHFDYSIIVSQAKIDYWGARIYLELNPAADPVAVEQQIEAKFGNINSNLASDELFGGITLQPVQSIHFGSDLLYELKPPGDIRYLYIISLIALIILLLTVSNYTNLSVVMNAGRAREVGMRKVFGASEGQIAVQFLLEAILLSLLTFPLVLLGLWWIIPRFNQLMGITLSTDIFTSPALIALLTGLTLLIGFLAGCYPALYLSKTRIKALFGGRVMQDSSGKLTTRKVIITFQFALLIGLCSLTLFVNRQLNYIQQKDLGFKKEKIVYVQINADSSRFATFRNEVLRLPGVKAVGSGTPMGISPFNQLTYKLSGTDQVYDDAHNIYLDYAAIKQLGIETSVPDYVANPDRAPDRLILINNTLAERLKNRFQLTDAELIGQSLIQEPEYTNEETGEIGFPYPISGIFSDLHLFSLRESIDPMFMTVYRSPRYAYTASISYDDTPSKQLLADIEVIYDKVGLAPPFTTTLLEDNISDLYQEEKRISTLSNYFSLLALFLAIIGLVALTAFLTTLKRKEIGVRKILGASHLDILKRFNLEYVPLLLVAGIVTVPLVWWGISRWLEGFAYRISVDLWVFILAVLMVAVVTVIAVSLVVLRATRSIPARVLTQND